MTKFPLYPFQPPPPPSAQPCSISGWPVSQYFLSVGSRCAGQFTRLAVELPVKPNFISAVFFCSSFRVVNIDMSGVTWADDRGRGYGCGRMTSGGGHVLQQVCAALCTSAGRSHTLVTGFPASEKRSLLKNVSLGRAIPREYQGQVRERRCLSWQFLYYYHGFCFCTDTR